MEPSFGTTKYQPGDTVSCRIEGTEPGGYKVKLIPSETLGYLPSEEPVEIGSVVNATFICIHKGQALLANMIRTDTKKTSDAGNAAFSLWANAQPQVFRVQRAVDLFMPPALGAPLTKRLSMEEADRFFSKLERDEFTGCVKVDSNAQRSRSAVLFFHGRAVGAIYGKKSMTEPYRIETSLLLMLEDMRKSSTEIEYYTLADEYVLALSSLFLGVVVERAFGYSNQDYTKSVYEQFMKHKSTGCLILQHQLPYGLGFVCRGRFSGVYSVEDRVLLQDPQELGKLCDRFPAAKLEAFLLPDMISSSSMQFGYSLSSGVFSNGVDA